MVFPFPVSPVLAIGGSTGIIVLAEAVKPEPKYQPRCRSRLGRQGFSSAEESGFPERRHPWDIRFSLFLFRFFSRALLARRGVSMPEGMIEG